MIHSRYTHVRACLRVICVFNCFSRSLSFYFGVSLSLLFPSVYFTCK